MEETKMFESATDTELLVADILADLPRMISLVESQSAIHESSSSSIILLKNWACKRKRSSSSSRPFTCSSFLVQLPLSPEAITAIAPPPPPLPSKLRVSRREKRRFRERTVVVRKPETKSLPFTVSKASDDDGSKALKENPPRRRRGRNCVYLSRDLPLQREWRMRLYERVKAYELQLSDKEKRTQTMPRTRTRSLSETCNHWLALSLQPIQQ